MELARLEAVQDGDEIEKRKERGRKRGGPYLGDLEPKWPSEGIIEDGARGGDWVSR